MESVPASRPAAPVPPETLRGDIERFLELCGQPAIIEPGIEPLPLVPDGYALSCRGAFVLLEAWDGTRTFARRVLRVAQQRPGRLLLEVQRFGRGPGSLTIADLDDARTTPTLRRNQQESLAGRLAAMLARQFPDWRVEELTAGADLEHTLSPAHPRALLRRGARRLAALCAPASGGGEALTFGLLWLAYLRKREAPQPVSGLALFLPRGEEVNTRLRVRHLDPEKAAVQMFVYDVDEAGEQAVPPDDTGNLLSRLEPWCAPEPAAATEAMLWARLLTREPGVEAIEIGGSMISLRVAGLEFARAAGRQFWLGVGRKRRGRSLAEAVDLARRLAAVRLNPDNPRDHEWARSHPEARLESLVRANLGVLDASLRPAPVYGQVTAIAGRDRGLVDLLAIDHGGRLAVIELKASEDPHLPLQALDYWIRVRHHAAEGEFGPAGLFPGLPVRALAPRLLLVAPALRFHSTTETLLEFLPSELEVERIGLGVEWQRRFRVILRVAGAARPEWPGPPPERT